MQALMFSDNSQKWLRSPNKQELMPAYKNIALGLNQIGSFARVILKCKEQTLLQLLRESSKGTEMFSSLLFLCSYLVRVR